MEKFSIYFLRVSLAASYLSAVGDRFGLWGAPGTKSVSWGNFENFKAYTATLNPYAPESLVSILAWTATLAEVLLAILLLVGIRPRETALSSGLLLGTFIIAMTFSLGIKGPLDYSVFTACAASFLLSSYSSKKAF